MRILLNFFPVQSGGGQQVAISFIQTISEYNFSHEWFLYLGRNSELHELAKDYFNPENILTARYSYYSRLFNRREIKDFIHKNNIDIIYNYAPVLPIKNIPQVVRSVYSNLYFPEIKFWKSYPFVVRVKKKIIDYLRLKGTLKANGLIFENKAMQERANQLFGYPLENTIYIEPSVSAFNEKNTNEKYEFLSNVSDFKILYLSSWYLNKNITVLPEVSYFLKKDNLKIKFILTLNPEHNDIQKHLISKIKNYDVSEYFIFIDKVKAIYVHQIIKYCDAMILLSKLECFSSNIIESFYFKKPLIVSDEQWARAACDDAAFYVNRDEARNIKNAITDLVNNEGLNNNISAKGTERLETFNTPFDKVKKQVQYLENVYEKYKFSY